MCWFPDALLSKCCPGQELRGQKPASSRCGHFPDCQGIICLIAAGSSGNSYARLQFRGSHGYPVVDRKVNVLDFRHNDPPDPAVPLLGTLREIRGILYVFEAIHCGMISENERI
jgi:hypothetical protein